MNRKITKQDFMDNLESIIIDRYKFLDFDVLRNVVNAYFTKGMDAIDCRIISGSAVEEYVIKCKRKYATQIRQMIAERKAQKVTA